MSFRSLRLLHRPVFTARLVVPVRPAVRPLPRRFYTQPAVKQQQQITSMASPPGVIQAAKETAPKTSKLKELTKKYGAAGVLVYLGVGMVDLGVIFGVIQVAGLDKVKSVERAVMETVYTTGAKWGITKNDPTEMMEENKQQAEQIVKAEDEKPSLLSVFLLAYGIHKTLLLPVRLTITAAITPAVVRKLHQIGVARYFPRLFGASVPK